MQITARPNAPGNLTNRVAVGSASIDTQLANNSSSVNVLANASPTLGFISDRSINEDASLGPISFTVGDFETPAGNLTLAGFSSNPAVAGRKNLLMAAGADALFLPGYYVAAGLVARQARELGVGLQWTTSAPATRR